MSQPDFKPEPRIVDPKALPLDGSPKATGVCPCCRRHVGRDRLTRHHVVPKQRGGGGDDVAENLVWVCGDGTRGCHGVLTHRNRDGETGLTFEQVGERLVEYVLREVPEVNWYAVRKRHAAWLVEYYAPQMLDRIEDVA